MYVYVYTYVYVFVCCCVYRYKWRSKACLEYLSQSLPTLLFDTRTHSLILKFLIQLNCWPSACLYDGMVSVSSGSKLRSGVGAGASALVKTVPPNHNRCLRLLNLLPIPIHCPIGSTYSLDRSHSSHLALGAHVRYLNF